MRKPTKKKSTYKGPYPNNPNLDIQNVRKSMRTDSDGPTIDTFSNIDTTTNINDGTTQRPSSPRTKRPTKEKPKKGFNISADWLLGSAFVIASTIVGIVIYNHSNNFVSINKDIEFIKDNAKEQKSQIEKINDQNISIDKKLELLNQKVEFNNATHK